MKKLYRYTVVMNDDEVINLWSKSKEIESINDTWLYFEKNEKNVDEYFINISSVKYVRAVKE